MNKFNLTYKYPKNCKHLVTIALLLGLLTSLGGCEKYLNEKPVKAQYVPSTLADLQALLDFNFNLNQTSPSGLAEIIADNYYTTTADYQAVIAQGVPSSYYAANYIWDRDISVIEAWQQPYRGSIYYSNIVLDALPNIQGSGQQASWNSIKGSALFYRAFAFHQLAQLYCRPYSSTAETDLGIVLKLTSDINEKIKRSSVKATYDRIIGDIKEAVDLLPESVAYPTQPTKAAGYALLARVYLSMADYANAWVYANLTLGKVNTLIDYNSLIPIQTPPVKEFNVETIFFDRSAITTLINATRGKIDPILYQSYDSKDLRKTVFFKANTGANAGTYSFQGSYFGSGGVAVVFDGLTTAEMLLIRAECFARAGKVTEALADLNTLMIKRWKNDGSFVPITATSPDDAKAKILTERRKELVYRGLRWSDIRRLNLEGANITLNRVINSVTYTLPPNDLRSVLLIPTEVIGFSDIPQNAR